MSMAAAVATLLRPHQPPAINRPALGHLASVRVAGALTQDAQLYPTAGRGGNPGAFLLLHLQPAKGLPYIARVNLGTDLVDHMAAEADLVLMRTGALVSVAADWLELQHDHGHAALRLVNARDVVAFADLIQPTPTRET